MNCETTSTTYAATPATGTARPRNSAVASARPPRVKIAKPAMVAPSRVVATLLGPRRDDDPLALLTPRERDVLALMAEGHNNVGIARRLVLTDRTIETHIANIMAKLGLHESGEEHRRVLAVLTWLGVRQRGQ